jgi:hypothetical protein
MQPSPRDLPKSKQVVSSSGLGLRNQQLCPVLSFRSGKPESLPSDEPSLAAQVASKLDIYNTHSLARSLHATCVCSQRGMCSTE